MKTVVKQEESVTKQLMQYTNMIKESITQS